MKILLRLVALNVKFNVRTWAETIKLRFVGFPLSTQHEDVRTNTGWLRIRFMCLSEKKCLPVDCCFSQLAL